MTSSRPRLCSSEPRPARSCTPPCCPSRSPHFTWRSCGRLVVHSTPLLRTVAYRLGSALPSYVEVADLVQCGGFGLIDAVERFDPERSPRFESYAVARIRGAILDALRAQDWVPRSV